MKKSYPCRLTPKIPRGSTWDMRVIPTAPGECALVFSVQPAQHFVLVREGDRAHCIFIGRMFLRALGTIGVDVPVRLQRRFHFKLDAESPS